MFRRLPACGRPPCGEPVRASTSCSSATPADITTAQRYFAFRYRSPEHWIEVFRSYYGPLLKAFAALDASAQGRLEKEVIQLIERFNRAQDGSVVVPSAYLEIVITRA